MSEERKSVLAIDFKNIFMGGQYGKPLLNSHGFNTQGIRNFFMKLAQLKELINPDYIIMALDTPRAETFRRAMYPKYKSQRRPGDPELGKQLSITKDICNACGFPLLGYHGYEADDILGMVSVLATDNDMNAYIVSTDKDMYQLINDHVYIISPRIDEMITPEYVQKRYELDPRQWVDLKVLQGDRSDNIPGIVGIGETTALQLMHKYGCVDAIYDKISTVKPSCRKLLEDGQEHLDITRKLVTIVTDYKLANLTVHHLKRKHIYPEEVYELLEGLDLGYMWNTFRFNLLQVKGKESE